MVGRTAIRARVEEQHCPCFPGVGFWLERPVAPGGLARIHALFELRPSSSRHVSRLIRGIRHHFSCFPTPWCSPSCLWRVWAFVGDSCSAFCAHGEFLGCDFRPFPILQLAPCYLVTLSLGPVPYCSLKASTCLGLRDRSRTPIKSRSPASGRHIL